MVRATLRTPATDAKVQTAAAASVAPATPAAIAQPQPRPASPAVQPRVTPAPRTNPAIVQRGGVTPAIVAARPAPPAAPAAPAPRTLAARRPAVTVLPPAAAQPTIEVAAQVVPTPVADVTIETITTVAPSVEEQLLAPPATVEEPPPAPVEVVVDEGPTNPDEAPPVAPDTAIAVRPNLPVATRSRFADEGLEGDWGEEDLRYPRLSVVRGSGALSQLFNDGTLLYADEVLLPPPSVVKGAQNPLVWFTPLHITKGWRETLSEEEQKTGAMPRNAQTVEQVEEMGGTTRWIGGVKPTWSPSARCILILEKPEGSEHPGFVLPLDGRDYAVAVYYCSGGDFNVFAKTIYNTAKTVLQVPVLDTAGNECKDPNGRILKHTMLYKKYWTLGYQKVLRGNFQVWSPQIQLAKEDTGPELRAYCQSLLGATQAAEELSE